MFANKLRAAKNANAPGGMRRAASSESSLFFNFCCLDIKKV